MGILGLIFTLIASLALHDQAQMPGAFKVMMIVIYGFVLCLSGFGIATSVGLFRLRNWARISTIVWGSFLVLTAGSSILGLAVMPEMPNTPNTPDVGQMMFTVRVIGGCFWALVAAVGVWWIILFTRKGIRERFTNPQLAALAVPQYAVPAGVAPPPMPGYENAPPVALPPVTLPPVPPAKKKESAPVAIIIIACLLLLGVPSLLMLPFMPMPVMMFGHLFHGVWAKLGMVVYAGVTAAAAIGLLRLKPWAYYLTLAIQIFGVANMIVTVLDPDLTEKMKEFMVYTPKYPGVDVPDMSSMMAPIIRISMLAGGIFVVVVLVVLLYYRRPFMDAAQRAAAGKIAAAAPASGTSEEPPQQ